VSNRKKTRGTDWAPLSERLRAITDGQEAQLRAGLETAFPGFLDQLQAAAAEGGRHHDEMRRANMAADPDRCEEADPRNVPRHVLDQVTGLYLRVMTEVFTGERAHCGHIDLKAPRPAIACVHANWIYCRPCFARRRPGRPPLTEREEHTCDLCGTYRPKQTMHGLYPQVGPVMLIIGICPRCRGRLTTGAV
jgi:hypothetical protein